MKALSFLFKLFNLDGDDPKTSEEYQLDETKSAGGIILPQISRRKFLAGLGASAAVAAVGKSFSFPSVIPASRWDQFQIVPMGFRIPIQFSRLADAPAIFGGPDAPHARTATGSLLQRAGSMPLTPEIARRLMQQIKERLGAPITLEGNG